ncbi:phage replisome organizer N-terminal domain-containing protein, partial [Clostridium butyricum]
MADAKWIKIAIDMFNDPKLKIINSMEEKDLINYVWMRSLLLAGQSNMNGCLYINESMPYTMKTLAIELD